MDYGFDAEVERIRNNGQVFLFCCTVCILLFTCCWTWPARRRQTAVRRSPMRGLQRERPSADDLQRIHEAISQTYRALFSDSDGPEEDFEAKSRRLELLLKRTLTQLEIWVQRMKGQEKT